MTKLINKTALSFIVLSNVVVVISAYANINLTDYLTTKKSALMSVCVPKASTAMNELSESCPIGEGLWGNQSAKHDEGDSEFWIQCGLFRKTIDDAVISRLSEAVNAPINMKKEGDLNRCLIGPYLDYTTASKSLAALQRERLFKLATLREVDLSTIPKPEITPEVVAEPELDPTTIRKAVMINQTHFVVPFSHDTTEGFYMEGKMPWLRATAQHAQEICQQIDMNLVTKEQWKILADSTIMKKDKWPMQLPYWGANDLGLFKDGSTKKLKNTSMLNVVCTKKTEGDVVGNPI